ncbi:phosphotransferase [Nocardiopsis sp. FIRDI 009]|uniref:phosphotransferase n=1 Tax=Nocardiopsis sp. FIRDI 009 TaxID=714197 RepID=UPI000E278A24|nr:phosphotransferase [Nocardiopsis sp. FIRDI 009]
MTSAQSLANQRHRARMRELLTRAAEGFGTILVGEAVFGWRDRSIGAPAHGPRGDAWVRVTTEHLSWAHGTYWTGNADSSAITNVPKPEMIEVTEWEDTPNRVRAELMTRLPGRVCSQTAELRHSPELDDTWWTDLKAAVDRVGETSTERVAVSQEAITRRLTVFFADAIDPTVHEWRTAHADLHWNNLLAPELGILDWESWGRAPAGLDAATLLCHSLSRPATATLVRETFADQLNTPDGVRAQLYVIARLLLRIERGDSPELTIPLHRHAAGLLHG